MFLGSRRQLVRVLGHDITSTILDAMLYNAKFDAWRHEWNFPSPPILDSQDTLGHGFKVRHPSTSPPLHLFTPPPL